MAQALRGARILLADDGAVEIHRHPVCAADTGFRPCWVGGSAMG